MRPFLRAFVLFLSIFLFSVGTASAYTVFQIQLDDDTINPVTAEFIEESITAATRANAQCLIIKLDTPGGLLSSTRTIVKNIMKSKTPVVVYIAPAGSRAGSAGTFITYASHVAAMAPSTNIGAAHPVQMNGFGPGRRDEGEELRKLIEDIREIKEQEAKNSGKEEKAQSVTPLAEEKTEAEKAPEESKALQGTEVPENDDDPMTSKIVNDTTAFIRAISEERGRNTEWAVKSVVESESIISSEALEKGVIDLIAVDDKDLLEKLDGRTIKLTTGTVTLHTKDASVQILRMDARQKFFNVLANPNCIYIIDVRLFRSAFRGDPSGRRLPGNSGGDLSYPRFLFDADPADELRRCGLDRFGGGSPRSGSVRAGVRGPFSQRSGKFEPGGDVNVQLDRSNNEGIYADSFHYRSDPGRSDAFPIKSDVADIPAADFNR
jgi:membrane-bound serine protease (ClpP class)